MSKYATYKIWDGCTAPNNIESGGHLAGQLVNRFECDRESLLKIADEIAESDVDGVIDWPSRIREACGVDGR